MAGVSTKNILSASGGSSIGSRRKRSHKGKEPASEAEGSFQQFPLEKTGDPPAQDDSLAADQPHYHNNKQHNDGFRMEDHLHEHGVQQNSGEAMGTGPEAPPTGYPTTEGYPSPPGRAASDVYPYQPWSERGDDEMDTSTPHHRKVLGKRSRGAQHSDNEEEVP